MITVQIDPPQATAEVTIVKEAAEGLQSGNVVRVVGVGDWLDGDWLIEAPMEPVEGGVRLHLKRPAQWAA